MGTFSSVRTKHKLYQSLECVEETSTCSSELGGSASFLNLFFIEKEIHQWWGWGLVERLAIGKAGHGDLRSLIVCVCALTCKS